MRFFSAFNFHSREHLNTITFTSLNRRLMPGPVAMSVLNTSFRASGKLVGSDYFGSIYWDGADPHTVVLDELSKYADPQPGQEVVTTGFSQYFPADVLIGWVESAELNETRTAFKVRVRLAAEMSRLTDVILVENRDLTEIRDLLKSQQGK